MADRKVTVEVTVRRVVLSDPQELEDAIRRWNRSMQILFELQDKFEAGEKNKVPCLQSSTTS